MSYVECALLNWEIINLDARPLVQIEKKLVQRSTRHNNRKKRWNDIVCYLSCENLRERELCACTWVKRIWKPSSKREIGAPLSLSRCWEISFSLSVTQSLLFDLTVKVWAETTSSRKACCGVLSKQIPRKALHTIWDVAQCLKWLSIDPFGGFYFESNRTRHTSDYLGSCVRLL